MCSGVKPTHVVTSITYGGNAHFVFRKVEENIKKRIFKMLNFRIQMLITTMIHMVVH